MAGTARRDIGEVLVQGRVISAEQLTQVDGWDSLSTVEFIGMAHKHFGLALSGNCVVRCQTVDELLRLLGPALTDQAA